MQLTTQKGMTAGLEADQAAKLSHLDSLKGENAALRGALEEQQELAQTAESRLEAAQADLAHHDLVTTGQIQSAVLLFKSL